MALSPVAGSACVDSAASLLSPALSPLTPSCLRLIRESSASVISAAHMFRSGAHVLDNYVIQSRRARPSAQASSHREELFAPIGWKKLSSRPMPVLLDWTALTQRVPYRHVIRAFLHTRSRSVQELLVTSWNAQLHWLVLIAPICENGARASLLAFCVMTAARQIGLFSRRVNLFSRRSQLRGLTSVLG